MYADVETLLVGWLSAALGVRVLTDTPANLETVLPVVQVTRIAGADVEPSLDQALVDIDCYAASRGAASHLCEQVRTSLRFALPGHVGAGCLVSRVDTATGPSWRPYDNSGVRRFGASFHITVQSHN